MSGNGALMVRQTLGNQLRRRFRPDIVLLACCFTSRLCPRRMAPAVWTANGRALKSSNRRGLTW